MVAQAGATVSARRIRDVTTIRALLLDPTDANTLYLCGLHSTIWVHSSLKSTDGGATWNYLPPGGTLPPALLEMSQRWQSIPLPRTVSMRGSCDSSDAHGVFKSTDGGMTWSKTGLTDTTCHRAGD